MISKPRVVRKGTLSSPGPGPDVPVYGNFNLTISGTFVGKLRLERAFHDAPSVWYPITYIDGSPLEWTGQVSTAIPEVEGGVLVRVVALELSSGTAVWRVGM